MQLRFLVLSLLGLVLAACAGSTSDSPDPRLGQGGSPNTGGIATTGGTRTGGMGNTGGNTATGGITSTGGVRTGGITNTGGTTGTGGITTAGGTRTGGTVSTGGTRNTGGIQNTGGTQNRGGSPNTGGIRTGGVVTTGGTSATGGINATGGSNATGGNTGAGGAIANGCSIQPPTGTPVATHGQLKVVGTRIQDQSGADVQLKGISSMWLNWEDPKYMESKAAQQYMRDNWKIKLVRAAMGIEVQGGYLAAKAETQARVDTIIQNALQLGLYVIIDWHTERAVDQTSESVSFFTAMAEKYGKCPNILYEPYNEPTKVTWDQIKKYHETVVAAIRAKDPDNLIILGTPDWSSGVDKAAASPLTGTNLLYTLHFYSCAHTASSRALGDAVMAKGLALFISEFGLTPADGGVPPNNKVCESEANLWWDWMAKNGISGAGWKLVSGVDSSNIFSSTNKPPADGPFPDSVLSQTTGVSPGHGQIMVNWLKK